MKLRIGILGTRGIPNRYGGFEEFASHLSKGLVEMGHSVSVYNSHKHPYKENNWFGVVIIHCFDPEYLVGTAGQFIYDLNCIRDAHKRNFDILLVLGYTSSSVWGKWYPKKSIVVTNMDGLEWKRSRYTKPVQFFLQYAEKLAVRFSNYHIADSVPIQEYLHQKYAINAAYISYGADITGKQDASLLKQFGINRKEYYLLIARMEPENNIEMILDGLCTTQQKRNVLVIGGTDNAFGKRILAKYAANKNIQFPGAIYDKAVLDTLRSGCWVYFHGHSVGGTNPSLLEAMAAGALICAHDNLFNKAVLGEDAFYFQSAMDIETIIRQLDFTVTDLMKENNLEKIRNNHSWKKIIAEYGNYFLQAYPKGK
jgi:glycosyltransferase involved in cell wall biosynthesis